MHSSSVELWIGSGTGVFIRCSTISCRHLLLSLRRSVRADDLVFFCCSLSASFHASGEFPLLRRWVSISRALHCLSKTSRARCRQGALLQELAACATRRHQVFPPGSGTWSRASAIALRVFCCPALWLSGRLPCSANRKDQGLTWWLAAARVEAHLHQGSRSSASHGGHGTQEGLWSGP